MSHVTGLRARLHFQPIGPVNDERRRNATLVCPVLVLAKGCVSSVGPRLPVRAIRVGGSRGTFQITTKVTTEKSAFMAGSVVGQEQEQRVVEPFQFTQPFDHPTDVPVHPIDHGRVDGHSQVQLRLLFVGELLPVTTISRTEFPLGEDQSHLDHPVIPLATQLVPTAEITPLVLLNELRWCVQRPVRGIECQVKKERPLGVFFDVVVHGCECLICKHVRRIKSLSLGFQSLIVTSKDAL